MDDEQFPATGAPESNTEREDRYRKMRERAMQRRQEASQRWDSYWKVLDAMTPEQKEAIEAIFGRMPQRLPPCGRGIQMPPGMPMQPHFGPTQYGFPYGSGFSWDGSGPQGLEPSIYDGESASGWFNQQPVPPRGFQPWHGGRQDSFQGPPPPETDETQP
jgi:hypothetical protein